MMTRYGDIDRTFALMAQLRRRMDRLFDDLEPQNRDSLRPNLISEAERFWDRERFPRITLADEGTHLTIKVEVPGLGEKDLQLSIHQDVLTIAGERKPDAPEGYYVHRQERNPVKFARTFTLPAKVDPEKSTATLTDGVLTVMLTKTPEAQPRQIAVKVK